MLANINYHGQVLESVNHLKFSYKPAQYVLKCKDYTLVIFRSGKCRIMGCKKPLDESSLPMKIFSIRIQSVTVTANLGTPVHLYKLAVKLKNQCTFEPELFSALRYLKYNPMCVNIFSSGKVVILGLKSLDYHCTVKHVCENIHLLI
jgi:TATA-box binding protein (TBP) (component of TFIID and TFIIIB)